MAQAADSAPNLGSQRHLFDLPDDVVYLNTANLGPQLHSVHAAGEQALARRAAPWRIRSADWFSDVERLRALFAGLIGADPEGVALINATSYGLNIAAANVAAGPGDRIVLIEEDYPSTVYTWRSLARRTGVEIVTVGRSDGHPWTEALLAAIVRARARGLECLIRPRLTWSASWPL